MIGQYVNTGRGSCVTIIPAVPGAQYRITAWALGDGRRSTTPAVADATMLWKQVSLFDPYGFHA